MILTAWGHIKRFFNYLGKWLKELGQKLSNISPVFPNWEKLILLVLVVFIICGSGYLIYQKYLSSTQAVPAVYGEYTEGIIADSISDVQPVIRKLTKTGLLKFDAEGKIQPNLATSWEISEDQKSYTLELSDLITADEVEEVIRRDKDSWSDIAIEKPASNKIVFKLNQPFAPLLANLTESLFSYGPYKIEEQTKLEINFVSRDNALHTPYIEKINLKLYPDYENLIKALKAKQLDGIGYVETAEELPESFNYYDFQLPRYQILFFNLNSEVWDSKAVRQKLANNEPIGEEKQATLVTSTKQINQEKAFEIQEQWAELGVQLELAFYEPSQLQSDIIPNRQYDILLYGFDYGYDPDPYPFWHSSQATDSGLNLSNFSHVDADKFLEQARMTINEEERNQKYAEFQAIFDDEVPAIIISQDTYKYGISDKIMGVPQDFVAFSPADRFFEVYSWYIKEKRVKK